MPTASTTKLISQRPPRESSIMRSARDADDVRQQWKDGAAQNAQLRDVMLSVQQLTRLVEKMRRRILGGAGGIFEFPWQKPYKELDTTLNVASGTFVYVTPGNVLVTAGMTDILTDETVITCEGIWQAAQDVPAASGGKYNVPLFPYPYATGLVIGTAGALQGDLDNPTLAQPDSSGDSIFWIYWGAVAC